MRQRATRAGSAGREGAVGERLLSTDYILLKRPVNRVLPRASARTHSMVS